MTNPTDRKVCVVGSPESQWKAQYLIYEKLREDAFNKVKYNIDTSLNIVTLITNETLSPIQLLTKLNVALPPNYETLLTFEIYIK